MEGELISSLEELNTSRNKKNSLKEQLSNTEEHIKEEKSLQEAL